MNANGYKIEPYANLRGSDLRDADLRGSNLYGSDLRGSDLRGANLGGANLGGANLGGADLYGADLRGANLGGANLGGADLYGANLYGADLRGANLGGADLYGANLYDADLRGAKNIPDIVIARTTICAEGVLRVYKKCLEGIVELEIPAEAARTNATGRKCRAEYAIVRATPNGKKAHSIYSADFAYYPGEIVRPSTWCADRWQECAGGIHFYLTREEAEAHD